MYEIIARQQVFGPESLRAAKRAMNMFGKGGEYQRDRGWDARGCIAIAY